MKTIKTIIYKFDELSENGQINAIDNFRDINTDFNWWEQTYEDAENIGLKITSFGLDRQKEANGEFIQDANFCANEILKNHGETCETYQTAKEFIELWNNAVSIHSDGIKTDIVTEENEYYFDEYIEDAENDFLKDILNDYSNILQNESEYLQSDEAIKETIEANEYEFYENGKLY